MPPSAGNGAHSAEERVNFYELEIVEIGYGPGLHTLCRADGNF